MKRLESLPPAAAPGPLAKAGWALAAVVAVTVAVVASVAVVAVVAVAGAFAWGYLAWKTRALRRAVRDELAAHDRRAPVAGQVIEGEAVSVPDERR